MDNAHGRMMRHDDSKVRVFANPRRENVGVSQTSNQEFAEESVDSRRLSRSRIAEGSQDSRECEEFAESRPGFAQNSPNVSAFDEMK